MIFPFKDYVFGPIPTLTEIAMIFSPTLPPPYHLLPPVDRDFTFLPPSKQPRFAVNFFFGNFPFVTGSGLVSFVCSLAAGKDFLVSALPSAP